MFRRIPKWNRTGIRDRYTLCRKPIWHPANAVCLLDNFLHRLHFDVNPVCAWHDQLITGTWISDLGARRRLRRFVRLSPVETEGPGESKVTFTGPSAPWVTATTNATIGSGTTTYIMYPQQTNGS